MAKASPDEQPTGQLLIQGALAELSLIRPIFHSEADFQHALAWHLRQIEPKLELRLEVPLEIDGRRIHVDIVTRGSRRIAIELKYWTAKLDFEHKGEKFKLIDQAAHDLGRCDFAKDIRRLERLVDANEVDEGYAVALSADSAYWKAGREGTVDEAFRVTDGGHARVAGPRRPRYDEGP